MELVWHSQPSIPWTLVCIFTRYSSTDISKTMAKNYSKLQSVMEILKEVLKIPRRNKKIFLFIIISTMILYSILLLAIVFSMVSLSKSLFMRLSFLLAIDPKAPAYFPQLFQITDDFIPIMAVGLVFLLLMFVVSLFSMVATVCASAMSYLGRDLTVMDLYAKVKQIWVRPVVTLLYIWLFNAGYFVLILPICFLVAFGGGSMIVSAVMGLVVLVLTSYLGMYLYLVWMLSLVTSVLEDCYGLEALGKAEKLVKGRTIVGLVLTFLFMVLTNAIVLVNYATKNHETVMVQLLIMYVTLNIGILVKIVSMMVYTVFYFERKQSHGEQVEVDQDKGYSRLSTIPLVASALPLAVCQV